MNYLMRSILFVLAYNEKFINKAIDCNADVIAFYLEDGVPTEKEESARINITRYLKEGYFNNKQVLLRVNELDTESLTEDLKLLVFPQILGIILPKINDIEDVQKYEKLVCEKEKEFHRKHGSIKLLPLIETAAAVLHVERIAGCNSRIIALLFGGEDYDNNIWGVHTEASFSFDVPRSMIVLAARMHNILPVDTPYTDISNEEGFMLEEGRSDKMGFAGALLVTPRQIPWANKCFSPTAEEIEHAEKVLAAINQVKEIGGSISKVDGIMVGPPMRKRAEKVMELVNMINGR